MQNTVLKIADKLQAKAQLLGSQMLAVLCHGPECSGQAVTWLLPAGWGVTGGGEDRVVPLEEQCWVSAGLDLWAPRAPGSPPCSALPPSEEDIVIEEFARQKLKGEKDDEDEKEEAEKEES